MQETILYVFLVVMGLFVGSLATGLWLLPRFVELRTQLENAWDDVGTALQTPSDDSTGPEYRDYMLRRLREIREERNRGK
jgi:hypothetical protein